MNTKALRQKVLDLAIHGKLVPQNPNDESATALLEKIRAEKAEKIKKGELKADKKDSFIFTKECEFDEDKLGKCSSGTRHKRHYEQFADGTVKDIEDEIPFDVPEGWAWCRLPEICVIPITDGTHQTPTYSDKKKGVPFLSSKDVTSGKIDWSKIKYITKELHQELQKRIAPKKDDILLAKNGTTGVAAIVEDETIFDIYVTLAVIRPNQKIVYPKFLLNIINSPFCKNQFNEHLTGIGVPNLHLVDINKTFVPLPPLNEQRQITDKIGSYTVHIDELEKNKSDLQTAIKQTKSKILALAIHGKLVPQDPNDEPAEELLKRIATCDNRPYEKVELPEIDWTLPNNWCFCHFGDIAAVINGKNQSKVENPNGKYPIYGSGGIMGRADDYICPENCTIIGRKGSINNPIFVEEKFWNVDTAFGLSPSEAVLPRFLFYFCEYFDFTTLDSSTTLPSLTKTNIQQIIFALPPIEEQKRILDKTEELFRKLDEIVLNLI